MTHLSLRLVDEDIPIDFKLRGFEALVKTSVEGREAIILDVFKRIVRQINLDGKHTLELIRATDYFVKLKRIDKKVLEFIEYCAICHQNPESDENQFNNILTHAINSVRGVACSTLVLITFSDEFKDSFFSILNLAAQDRTLTVRVAIIQRLANLMKVDEKQTLDLFLQLVESEEPGIYQHSTWTAQYLTPVGFAQMRSYFEFAITVTEIQEKIAKILMVAWLRGYNDSEQLLEDSFMVSDAAKSGALSVAFTNVGDENIEIRKKCLSVIQRFNMNNSDEVRHAATIALGGELDVDFRLLEPYLVNMFKRKEIASRLGQIFQFMENQIRKYPVEIVNTLRTISALDNLEPHHLNLHFSPLKIILQSYRYFWDNDDDEQMENTIDVFDLLLLNRAIRIDDRVNKKPIDELPNYLERRDSI